MEKLAANLSELIQKHGTSIKAAAESVLVPRFNPEKDVWPDLSSIEKLRSKFQGKSFRYFHSQLIKIAGAVQAAREFGGAWMVCAPGTGKTAMSVGVTTDLLKNAPKNWRVMVMAPGHLVKKWKREIDWLVPNVESVVLEKFQDLLDFHQRSKTAKHPMFAVVGKDRAKLGFDVDAPCCDRSTKWVTKRFKTRVLIPADAKNIKTDYNCVATPHEATVKLDIARCPVCGAMQYDKMDADKNSPLSYSSVINCSNVIRCNECKEKLTTSRRGHNKNPHMDRYIQRKMKGVFDMLIADEVHELAGAETIQGNCFGTISSACRFTLALTGTLIGGNAKDLHALLWRMAPDLMRVRGFDITKLKNGKVSAISRNEKNFVTRYGVMETQVIHERGKSDDHKGRVQRGSCGRKKNFKTVERPRPGISPDLFNHFMLERAVFMELDELGQELPTMERVLIPCKPSNTLRQAYDDLDAQLESAIKERVTGNGPPVLAGIRIGALDSYLDTPFGWDGIYAPVFGDDGVREGSVCVANPENFKDGHLDSKDEKLLETIKSELAQNRRCCIYVSYVGKHDVRPKIVKMLQTAGIRVKSMPDSLKAINREEWVINNVDDMDVLVVMPKRVMTGLDLVQFPSLIWYQLGFSTHVLRQASARARRPIQTMPCKVFFLYYEKTIQEQSLAFMGEKEAASQALEGTFDTRALKALMNGGENDDIMGALASNLVGKDAKKAWSHQPRPTEAPTLAVPTNRTEEPLNPRTSKKPITQHVTSKVCCSNLKMFTIKKPAAPVVVAAPVRQKMFTIFKTKPVEAALACS